MVSTTVRFDEETREIARSLCAEYGCSVSHLVRQLLRAEFRSVYPNVTKPMERPARPRPLDKDSVARRRGPRAQAQLPAVSDEASSPDPRGFNSGRTM
jgi:hypothetical protein